MTILKIAEFQGHGTDTAADQEDTNLKFSVRNDQVNKVSGNVPQI